MNDLAKNLLLWIVIAVVLMAVFNSFTPGSASSEELSYSQFLEEVQADSVKSVEFADGDRTIRFTRNDGQQGVTYAPSDPDLVNELLRNRLVG